MGGAVRRSLLVHEVIQLNVIARGPLHCRAWESSTSQVGFDGNESTVVGDLEVAFIHESGLERFCWDVIHMEGSYHLGSDLC